MHRRIHRFALHLGRWSWHISRWSLYVGAGLLVLALIAVVAVRMMLPALAQKKGQIEQFLSAKAAHPIRIAELDARWEGWHPALRVRGLQIFSASDLTQAIRLREVRITLALLPLLWGDLQIHTLVLERPRLSLERLADGRLQITGLGPVETGRTATAFGLVPWLLGQRHLSVEDGELQWFDHQGEQRGLYISHINLDLRNSGRRHRFTFTADFPPALCRDCAVTADLNGSPNVPEAWSSRVFVKALALNLNALPAIVRERLPEPLAGTLDLRLWTTWHGRELRGAEGDVSGTQLQLPASPLATTVSIHELRTNLSWQGRGTQWQLNLDDLWLGLTGPAWSVGHVQLTDSPQVRTVRLDSVQLDDVGRFLAALAPEQSWADRLRQLRPSGRVSDVSVRIAGDGRAADDYTVEAKIENLHTQPVHKIPGVQGLTGTLSTRGRSGTFVLGAVGMTVTVPEILRVPVHTQSAAGRLSWTVDDEHWQLHGENLRVAATDGSGTGRVEVRGTFGGAEPYLNLHVDFHDGNGAHASRYFPINVLPPNLIAWLDRSIISGYVTTGSLVIEGNMEDFPFREGNGTFEVRAHVRDAVFNYLPGWTPLTEAEGDMLFKGPGMLITQQHGAIGSLSVGHMIVRSDDLSKEAYPIVSVDATIDGTVSEAFRVLRAVPASNTQGEWRPYLDLFSPEGGKGTLKLQIDIPATEPDRYTLAGNYAVENASLRFRGPGIKAERVHGNVAFNRWGPTNGELQGYMLGGNALVQISGQGTVDNRETLLSGWGTFTAAGLAASSQLPLAKYLRGDAQWKGNWRLYQGQDQLHLTADLSHLRSLLPPPLARPDGIAQQLDLSSQGVGSGERVVSVRIGEHIEGRFFYVKRGAGWEFLRGGLALDTGEPPLSGEAGLTVSAHAAELDAGPWLEVFKFDERAPPPDFLRRLTGDFDSVLLLNRPFGHLRVDVLRHENTWSGQVSGDAVNGRVSITQGRAPPVASMTFDLERLTVPTRGAQGQKLETDPRALPTVQVRAKLFQYESRSLGALDFAAEQTPSGWKIVRFNLVRPEMTFKASGSWSVMDGVQVTQVDFAFQSSDMGVTLDACDLPDQMVGGKVELSGTLSWQGPPAEPQLATLDGAVHISGEKGRFLKLKPGATRLFGILDFSAVGKFFTGKFGALFGKGLAFDRIRGDVSIEKGDAYTHNLRMTGGTQLSFNGRVGLAKEDFDLAVKVVPSLGTNIGVWGILGPEGGLILLALEKLFKKQFAAGTSLTYLVKGPWADPTVEPLEAPTQPGNKSGH